MSEKLQIIIEASDGTRTTFDAIKQNLEDTAGAAEDANGNLSGMGGSLAGISANAGPGSGIAALPVMLGNLATSLVTSGINLMLDGLKAGLNGLADAVRFALDQAMEAQEIEAQLDAVIKSTGGMAGVTREQALALAEGMSQVTRYSDDAVLGAENVMLTFTNVGKAVFPEAVQAALDLSAAMGQDLQSSVVQIGKAVNDPIDGITALTRVGVSFTDEQKAMIEAMVASGDTMGAQRMILQELQKEFGGSAEAAGKTFAGQMDILKNSLGNTAETVGLALLPTLQELSDKLLKFVQSDEFKQWVEDVAKWLRDELPKAMTKVKEFWDSTLKPTLDAWWPILRDDILPALGDIAHILGVVLPPAIALFSGWIKIAADVIDVLFFKRIQNTIEATRTLKEELIKLMASVGLNPNTPEGQSNLSSAAGTTSMLAGLANPFAGAAMLATGGLGGGSSTVNLNVGGLFSFADEADLEAKLKALVLGWMR